MIKLLIGVSGLGKSSYARTIWNDDSVIINRDKIRELLWGHTESNISSYYDRSDFKKREFEVTQYQNELIEYSLSKGKTVILDNTHLQIKFIKDIIKKFYYTEIEFIDVAKILNINISELESICVQRDFQRVRQVGKEVITNQVNQYKQLLKDFDFKTYQPNIVPINQNVTLPKAIIFDIDGTLAERVDRSPFDWKKVKQDTCNEYVRNVLLPYYYKDYKIIICSGRDSICKDETEHWLNKHDIPYHELYVRFENNTDSDYIVKENMWKTIINKYYIEACYDDRHQVIFHGKLLGLNMINVKGVKQDF